MTLWPKHLTTEAVRVDLGSFGAGAPRLREAWERYRLPLIVSEAHLGCDDPHEQVPAGFWRRGGPRSRCCAEGADWCAVTARALFWSG